MTGGCLPKSGGGAADFRGERGSAPAGLRHDLFDLRHVALGEEVEVEAEGRELGEPEHRGGEDHRNLAAAEFDPEEHGSALRIGARALAKKGNDPVAGGAKDGKTAIVSEEIKNPLDGPYLIPGLPPIHPPIVPAISTPSSSDVTLSE